MDSERKMVSVVENLLRVVEELAEEQGVSEVSKAALDKTKRDATKRHGKSCRRRYAAAAGEGESGSIQFGGIGNIFRGIWNVSASVD